MKNAYARQAATLALTAVVLCTLLHHAASSAAPHPAGTRSSYRVETTSLLDRDDARLVKVRVESNVAFRATVNHGQGHTSCASSFDQGSRSHHVEIVLLFDHIASRQCVKELLTVGGAGGPSVETVARDFRLNDALKTKKIDGAYERDQAVELLKWQDRVYTLTIDP
jgi:hypothetical protein